MKKKTTQTMRKDRHCSVLCFAVLAAFALLAACERPEPEPVALITLDNGPIPFSEIHLNPMACGWNDTLLLHDNRVILINDTQDYHHYVDCDCGYYPVINFDKNSIVLWSGGVPGATLGSVDFECIEGRVILHLVFGESFTLGPPVYYVKVFLLPKIPSNAPISLDIYTCWVS